MSAEAGRETTPEEDYSRRIERTVEYVRIVRQHIHDPNARDALDAIIKSLVTPVVVPDA